MDCLNCKYDLDKFANWDDFNTIIECPSCGSKFLVDGDDIYNEDDNDDYSYFWLERAE